MLFADVVGASDADDCVVDGRIAPRSGLAAKHGIDTLAGVIDADYRGQVGVILANLSDADFEIKVGDRIAQLIVERVCKIISKFGGVWY